MIVSFCAQSPRDGVTLSRDLPIRKLANPVPCIAPDCPGGFVKDARIRQQRSREDCGQSRYVGRPLTPWPHGTTGHRIDGTATRPRRAKAGLLEWIRLIRRTEGRTRRRFREQAKPQDFSESR